MLFEFILLSFTDFDFFRSIDFNIYKKWQKTQFHRKLCDDYFLFL